MNSVTVTCGASTIEAKSNVKYLGVTLDQSLSRENIVNNLLSKCSGKLKFLCRNTRNFDLKTKKQLVLALIQCHFDYPCSSWYSDLPKKLKGLCKSK